MTLTIPYEWTDIEISTSSNGDLTFKVADSSTFMDYLFNQFLNTLSYDDIIRLITPQSFENIMEHYKTNYKES